MSRSLIYLLVESCHGPYIPGYFAWTCVSISSQIVSSFHLSPKYAWKTSGSSDRNGNTFVSASHKQAPSYLRQVWLTGGGLTEGPDLFEPSRGGNNGPRGSENMLSEGGYGLYVTWCFEHEEAVQLGLSQYFLPA